MARTHKTSEAFERQKPVPASEQQTRTELRNQDVDQTNNEMDATRSRVDEFFSGKDGRDLVKPSPDATPVGGAQPDTQSPEKPPLAEVSPPPPPTEGVETEEQFRERIDAMPKPKNAKQGEWDGLKNAATERHHKVLELHRQLEERENKIKELEGKIIPEEEVNRLRSIETIAQAEFVEKLPQWKQYDDAVQEIETTVTEFLKGFNVPESTLKALQDRGGISKFAYSKEPAGTKFKNADGTPMTRAQWFEEHVVNANKMTEADRRKLYSLIDKAEDKISEKTKQMAKAKEDSQGTLKKSGDVYWNQFDQVAKATIGKVLPNELKRFDLPLEKPKITGTEKKEEKAEKETLIKDWESADTRVVDVTRALGRAGLKAEDATKIGVKIGFYDVMAKLYDKLKAKSEADAKELQELRDFRDGIKSARRLPKSPSPSTPLEKPKPPVDQSTEERMAAAGF